jgi:D-alanine-D-alanine ligase
MKIAILHPYSADSVAPFKDFDPPCVPNHYLPGHDYEDFQLRKVSAVRQIAEIARMGFDAAINLCDGAWDEDRPGIEVVQALERFGLAFTGADSSFYDPSREAMKMACSSVGVKFPAYVLARNIADASKADRLRFPLIVKHARSYSSIGLTPESRVANSRELMLQTARMIDDYGAALIEEFVDGREFTALVAEARTDDEEAWVLDPIEFVFPESESFKHFDLKWKDFARMETRSVDDASLAQRLRDASALTFTALAGTGFGRCDLRLDAAGDIYVLEINPNCAMFYPEGQHGSADLILANAPSGHRLFLEHLLRCAIRRRDRATKPWELRFERDRGFGMFAARAIGTGGIVERYEASAHVLVSRGQVERHWTGLRKQWFQQYAWPLSNDLYVLWSDNPDLWRPINHACDPNTWLDGLDLIARRDVQAGEELTMDYATFCGPLMSPFACHCGSPLCRKIIRGSDYLLTDIRERYGAAHVSEFVRTAWRNAASDAAGCPDTGELQWR